MCKKLLMFVIMFGLVSTAMGQPTGEILFEYWYNIGGTAISDLTGQAAYPDNPDDGELRTSFDGNVDIADNYGQRVRGWLYPPEDGDYTFWVSGDDFCDLMLSTDADPANAAVIAQVPGWTSYQQWDSYPEQQSAPITLAAGQSYYIEGLMKEGGGGDSFTAAWAGPGIGEDITVIDGAYLSPADPSPSLLKAKSPDPADGAVDVDTAVLGWGSGFGDVASHQVYLNGELIIETDKDTMLAAAALDPGVTYTWRVDEVQGDGTVIEGNTWSFTTLPLEAHFPSPADGAVDVASPATLSWTPGKNTILNTVYYGTDMALVEARDASTLLLGNSIGTSANAGDLDLFMTYYWAVDEFTPAGPVAGPVWSFSSEGYVPILQGSQTLDYHNHGEPYVSELAIDVPADLTDVTAGGKVTNLVLNFQGAAPIFDVDEDTGTYTISGEGADVWGNSDQFHYVHMNLTGDGEITARVVSNGTGSNTWAKGGVMIRETTAPDSKHMIMALTGGDGGGIAFQGRMETGGASTSFHGDITASPPHWVKLTREGNTITAYNSADGVTWDLFTDTSPDGGHTNPLELEMSETVLVGLFVTSHADGENRAYTFDNVDIQGNVDGVIVSEDIDSESQGNDADPIYVALEDATGAVAVINHPNPAATQLTETQTWTIPVAAFGGVDLAAISKVIVGVGNGEPGGEGDITVSDVKVVDNDEVDIDIVFVSDMYDDSADGIADDLGFVKLLLDAGYVVDYTAGAAPGDGYWRTLDDEKIAALNAARLVIVSRNTDSGSYDNDDAVNQWNSITSPLILSSTHIVRSSRWKWVDSTSILNLAPVMELADGTAVVAIDDTHGQGSFIDAPEGNGTVLATGDGLPWIIKWASGLEYYDGAGQTAGGPRVFFVAGAQEVRDGVPPIGRGEMNLTAEGQAIYLNTILDLLNPNLIANGGLEDDISGAPWSTYGDASLEVVHELVDAAVPEGPIEGDHCLHVTVNSAGANFWDAGLQSAGKVFEAGKSYTLSVWLKSKSGPFDINIKPERAGDPYEGYGDQEITITEEWAEYTVNTGVIPETVDPASITFHIAYAAGEFWLDNAVFKEDL